MTEEMKDALCRIQDMRDEVNAAMDCYYDFTTEIYDRRDRLVAIANDMVKIAREAAAWAREWRGGKIEEQFLGVRKTALDLATMIGKAVREWRLQEI